MPPRPSSRARRARRARRALRLGEGLALREESVRRDGVPRSSSSKAVVAPRSSSKDAVDDDAVAPRPASSATGAGVGACQACTNAAAAASCPGVCATGRIFAAAAAPRGGGAAHHCHLLIRGAPVPIETCFRASRRGRRLAQASSTHHAHALAGQRRCHSVALWPLAISQRGAARNPSAPAGQIDCSNSAPLMACFASYASSGLAQRAARVNPQPRGSRDWGHPDAPHDAIAATPSRVNG